MDISAMFRGAVAGSTPPSGSAATSGRRQPRDEDWTCPRPGDHLVGEDCRRRCCWPGPRLPRVGDHFDGDGLALSPGPPRRRPVPRRCGPSKLTPWRGDPPVVHLSSISLAASTRCSCLPTTSIHACDRPVLLARRALGHHRLVASCANWFDASRDAYRSARAIARGRRCLRDATPRPVLLARFGRCA